MEQAREGGTRLGSDEHGRGASSASCGLMTPIAPPNKLPDWRSMPPSMKYVEPVMEAAASEGRQMAGLATPLGWLTRWLTLHLLPEVQHPETLAFELHGKASMQRLGRHKLLPGHPLVSQAVVEATAVRSGQLHLDAQGGGEGALGRVAHE